MSNLCISPVHFTVGDQSDLVTNWRSRPAPSGQNWFLSGSVSTLKSKLQSEKILLAVKPELFIGTRYSSGQNGKIFIAFPPLREDTCSSPTQAALCSVAWCPNRWLTGSSRGAPTLFINNCIFTGMGTSSVRQGNAIYHLPQDLTKSSH